MRPSVCRTLVLTAYCLLSLHAQASSSQQPTPSFRGATDLLLVDVSVLDKARHPVRDLQAADFTVRIDGKPRPVVAFTAIDVPPAPPIPAGEASWVRDVTPDVVSNEKKPGRLFVILLDDYSFLAGMVDQAGIIRARKAANAVVDAMGPDDRAAVVMSMYGHTAQDFTSDRQLLRAAVEHSPLFPRTRAMPGEPEPEEDFTDMGGCDCGACNIQTIDRVAQAMRALPEQRKVLFHISAGSVVAPSEVTNGGRKEYCELVRREASVDAIRHAQLANVTIESFDPRLLRLNARNWARPAGDAIRNAKAVLRDPALERTEFLRMVAEETGGRAVVNNNDIDLEVAPVIAETSAYYLLGVERPPASDGKRHSVQVRVNRKGVDVRTRKGYTDETATDRQAAAEAAKQGDLRALVDGPLQRSNIPLGLAVAAFPDAGGKPVLALTVGIARPSDAATPRTETTEVVSGLYYPETAGSAGSVQQRATMTFAAPDPRFKSYEVHSRLPAKPGRYALRVGVKTADAQAASVYTTVIVPDFEADLSLSGLVLSATPAPVSAATDVIADLLPVTPTVQRAFRRSDAVSAFMQVYEKGRTFEPVEVATTLTNARDEKVATAEQTLEGTSVGSRAAGTYRFPLPLAELPAGEYLLSVSVTAGTKNAGRQLRFMVEP